MQGATDIRLNVTMDSSQARGEAERLHREISRRYRAPDAGDALNLAWQRSTATAAYPFRPNPFNPNLPYEHARHSGIWWANHGGPKGLGNQEYRHQFFTEREAKYMGLQFAKGARENLRAEGKMFGINAAMWISTAGIQLMSNFMSRVGENNRGVQTAAAFGVGAGAGAIGGGIAGLKVGTMLGSGFGPYGLLIGAGVGLIGGGLMGGVGKMIGNRNDDDSARISFETNKVKLRENRRLSFSDMALQRQMEMMPSRVGKLQLIGSQLEQINNGAGKMSIRNLEGLYNAMLKGGTWGGKQYKKGDLDTTDGQMVAAFLQQQYGRRESLLAQQQQLQFTPFARPQEAITDEYSRKGFFVGGQIDVMDTNKVIISDMKRIIKLLDETRKNTADNHGTWG